jgi:sugar lactone lactonase YvrE
MANKLIRLRPVSASTYTPDAGDGMTQKQKININGLSDASGVAIDISNNIYVADADRHVIFKVQNGSNSSFVFAGKLDTPGNVDGQGNNARLNAPKAITADRRGTLWVIDSGNNLVRRVDENGNVSTVASIPPEMLGDVPGHIAVGASEEIFITDNTP